MKKRIAKGIVTVSMLILLMMGIHVYAQSSPNIENSDISIDLKNDLESKFEPDLRHALNKSLGYWKKGKTSNKKLYAVGVLRNGKDWGIVSMTSANLDASATERKDVEFTKENTFNIVYVKTDNGWNAALDDDSRALNLLSKIPKGELSEDARENFYRGSKLGFQLFPSTKAQGLTDYKLPWQTGEDWGLMNGHQPYYWHLGGRDIDFHSPNSGSNSKILTVSEGSIVWVCPNYTTHNTTIQYKDKSSQEIWHYGHVSTDTVITTQALNNIPQGTELGRLLEITNPIPDGSACGSGTATHLHLNFPEKPFTVDDYTFPAVFTGTDSNPTGPTPKTVYGNTIMRSTQGMTDPCLVPSSGAWTLPANQICTISASRSFTNNIIIPNTSTLIIPSGVNFDVDLYTKNIKVLNGGKLVVANGGKIF